MMITASRIASPTVQGLVVEPRHLGYFFSGRMDEVDQVDLAGDDQLYGGRARHSYFVCLVP